MKIFKRIVIILLCILGVHFLIWKGSDGFGIDTISSDLVYDPARAVTHSPADLAEAELALSQPYSYLASGSQSYAFASEDGDYVVKFFKHRRWRPSPFPSTQREKRKAWVQKKKRTVRRMFESCLAAYYEFREETGVFFLHLNKLVGNHPKLEVKDRLGRLHTIDLNQVEFLLQRRAVLTSTYLANLKEKGEEEKAKEAVRALVDLTTNRALKGYSDKDPHLVRNFGFFEGRAIQIDVGGFHKDPKKDFGYYRNVELSRIEGKFLPWIEKNYPEIAPYTRELLKERRSGL